jgi:hypothetical protein
MKRAKIFFLALAAIFFLLAFGTHIASFLEPTSLLPSGQVVSPDIMVIVSAVMLSVSIIVWFAGFFLTDLQGPHLKPEGGGGDWLAGIGILIQLVIRIPLWLNLVFLGFLVYLIATSFLIRAGSDELTTRLQIFGAVCSALNLHAIILLSASPRKES